MVVQLVSKVQRKRRTPRLATAIMVKDMPLSILSHVSPVFQNYRHLSHWYIFVVCVVRTSRIVRSTTWWQTIHLSVPLHLRLSWRMAGQFNHIASFDWNAVRRTPLSKCGHCKLGQFVYTHFI